MNSDTADHRANARHKLQLTRELQVGRKSLPHPSIGGTRGYPVWFRQHELNRARDGLPTVAHPISIGRWLERVIPYRMTGNTEKRDLVGEDLILLGILSIVHPQASQDEMAMFIFSEGGGLFSNPLISKRLNELRVTYKKVSVEAYDAFTPRNQLREELFWTRGLPLGKVGIERRKFIDIDEFAVEHRKLNRTKGWGLSCYRVRTVGNYTKDTKLTVILAIEAGDPRLGDDEEGSIARPRRWIKVRRVGGTDADAFASFCDEVCSLISGPMHIPITDDHRVLLWDNLRAHMTPIVYQTIEGRGGATRFSILPRPAYQPKLGPIEYKICDLLLDMQYNTEGKMNLDQMEAAIIDSSARIGPFDSTFEHCGYSENGLYE